MLDSQATVKIQSDQIASTNNWDTVFAVDFEAVNDGIRGQGSSPDDFDHTQSGGGDTSRLFGDFGDWELVGGSGHLLEMRLPIPTFTFEMTGEPTQTRSDAWATIQLSLYQVTGNEGSGVGGGTPVSFRSRPPKNDLLNANEFSVVVTDFGWPGSDSEQDLVDDCRIMLADYYRLETSLEDFDHTFVTVNLNSRLGKEDSDFSWIAPTDTSYGVLEDGGSGGGSFAVLCMTNGNTPPENHNVSPAIKGDKRAGFLINKPIFLDHMVKPGIANMFGKELDDTDWVEANFVTDSDSITNKNALTIPDFSIAGKDDVTAHVPARTFRITLNDTELALDYQGMHHPYYKVLGSYWYEAYHYLTISSKAGFDTENKQFKLLPNLDDDGNEAIDYRASLEKSRAGKNVDIALLILDILGVVSAVFNGVAAVKGATVAATAEGVEATGIFAKSIAKLASVAKSLGEWMKAHPAFIWAGVAIGILGIAGTVAKERFEEARETDPTLIKPDMQEFALNVLAPVQWPHDAGLTVEDVCFNGGFQITGTPDFTQPVEA